MSGLPEKSITKVYDGPGVKYPGKKRYVTLKLKAHSFSKFRSVSR